MNVVSKTIGQAIADRVKDFPHRDALIHTELGVRLSYGSLWVEVERVAKGLMALDIQAGDKVAIWAPNIPEWIFSMLAVSRMGALSVPIDPGIDEDNLHFILEQSECRCMIMSASDNEKEAVTSAVEMRDRVPSLEHVIVIGDPSFPKTILWSDFITGGDSVATDQIKKREATLRPEDPVAIMYTSGTTGLPKGVVLDHRGLINKSICSTERQGLTQKDRLALFVPLFHMFGNTCITLAGMLRGAALILPCKVFDPSRILTALHKETCTAFYGSPSMLITLVDHPKFKKEAWKSVKKGTIGGAPCPMELMRRLVEQIGVSDITVGYGITETSSWITMTHPDDPLHLRVSTIGTALPCNEIKIVDPVTGEDLPPNTQGELCTKGFLMKTYHKMPAATASAVDRKGWFHTGDLGEIDKHGYVRITGRLKDVIVRDGIEIYPVELEEVIYKRPEVSEVQVFGFADPDRGQEVAAWVKAKEGSELSLESLEAHVLKHVGPQKAPKHYKVVTDFPMTRTGKVQKFKLAEMAQKEYGRQ